MAHAIDVAKLNCLSSHQNPPWINKVPDGDIERFIDRFKTLCYM